MTELEQLRNALKTDAPDFWALLAARSRDATAFEELLGLATLRRQASRKTSSARRPAELVPLDVGLLGGCTLHPLADLLTQTLFAHGFDARLWTGEFDGYEAEIRGQDSGLYAGKRDLVVLLPSHLRCKYLGALTDARAKVEETARAHAHSLVELCNLLHQRTGAAVVLANYPLPARHDPGAIRGKLAGSTWTFRKLVNLELAFGAPSFVTLCDLEFLSARRGLLAAHDDRLWFDSKQPGSADFLVDTAHEIALLARATRRAPAKVLVTDLDNTLWGGVIGDDGLEGIEVGTTSPRGEAFRAFQRYLLDLRERGILLAVCSKNELATALEPFEKHPEMLLRREHFATFEANWQPKSDNLIKIAADLNLGADSLVFVDDNPSEIDIVRRYAPDVRTVLVGPDPADYVAQLEDCRHFEPVSITAEDLLRAEQYQMDSERQQVLESSTDMPAYLASLQMTMAIAEFRPIDTPRIAQLINKSNQFNLTTIRRSEAEIQALVDSPHHVGFSVRLADPFGDHGLIAVVIGEHVERTQFHVDTWLMSCRVLNRQVEEETLNEIVRIARERGCTDVVARFVPTKRNQLVRELCDRLGFLRGATSEQETRYHLAVASYVSKATRIDVKSRASVRRNA